MFGVVRMRMCGTGVGYDEKGYFGMSKYRDLVDGLLRNLHGDDRRSAAESAKDRVQEDGANPGPAGLG